MTLSKEEISSSFCQSTEQQKMGKMQLTNTMVSLMSGQLQTMKVIMSNILQVVTSYEDKEQE
jgi:hypothetical protein